MTVMEHDMPKDRTKAGVAAAIDHSVLKATATERQVRDCCAEALSNGFAAVCVNPHWVPLCAAELAGTGVTVCAVVGFPLGANASPVKAGEARLAVAQGARELDMVINIGAAKSGRWDEVEADIRAVVEAAGTAVVKAIIEACYLTDGEKVKACEAAERAGAGFVMTSTGFGTGGASAEDVRLIRATVGDRLKVKASGGIRSPHDALRMLEAGADRLGASGGVAIVAELAGQAGGGE